MPHLGAKKTAKVPLNAILSIPRSSSPGTLPEHVAVVMGGRTLSVDQIIGALKAEVTQFPPLRDRAYLMTVLRNTMANVIGPGGQLLRDVEGQPVKAHLFHTGPGFRVATSRDIRQEVLSVYEVPQ